MIVAIIVVASLLVITIALCLVCFNVIYKSPVKGQNDAHKIFANTAFEKPLHEATEALLKLPYDDCATLSYDKLVLHARLYDEDENAPLVLCFHGYRSVFGKDFATVSAMLKKHGYSYLMVDERSHMQSEGKCLTFGIKERKDVVSWAKEMTARFPNRPLFLYGMSMGAATVCMSSDQDLPKNVKGIIADAPFNRPQHIVLHSMTEMNKAFILLYPFALLSALVMGHFSLTKSSGAKAVKNAKCPLLIFHGTADDVVPDSESKEIYESNPTKVTRYEVENAGHCLSCLVNPTFYEEKLISFLKENQ